MVVDMLARIGFILSVVSFIGTSVIAVYQIKRDGELAYVHTGKLLNSYNGMKIAREAYQKRISAWKANIDSLDISLKKQLEDYDAHANKFTARERMLSQELIRTKEKQLMDYRKAIEVQMQQADAELTTQVVGEVNLFLKKYGERKGYKIVMAATEYGNIAYADEGLDITDDVIRELNKEYSNP
jgi:outer membrane protein